MATTCSKDNRTPSTDIVIRGVHVRQRTREAGLQRNPEKTRECYNELAKLYDEVSTYSIGYKVCDCKKNM